MQPGRDFVMVDQLTYVGSAGVGKGCLVGTHNKLLVVPVRVTRAFGFTHHSTEWTLKGMSPSELIKNFVSEPGVKTQDLENLMTEISNQIEGSVLHDLHEIRRLKVKSGFFSRGIYLNTRDSNVGWTAYPLSKLDIPVFVEFYGGHPAAQQ